MDKVLIDIEVVNGIIKAYNRTKNQTRIFGIVLGTKMETHIIYQMSYTVLFLKKEKIRKLTKRIYKIK